MSHENPVLIVDDDPHVRSVIARYLHSSGLKTEPASCSEEALERIARADIALVIIDLNLGPNSEDSGADLLSKIRGMDPDLPLIICSGYPEMADDHPDIELIPKPTSRDGFRRLVVTVKSMIRHRCRDVQMLETRQLGGETHRMMKDVHELVMDPETGLKATRLLAEQASKRTLGELLAYYKRDPLFWLLLLIISSGYMLNIKDVIK